MGDIAIGDTWHVTSEAGVLRGRIRSRSDRFATLCSGWTMAIQTFVAVEFYLFIACRVEVWVVARRASHVCYGALITGAGMHLFDMTQYWSRIVARACTISDKHRPDFTQFHTGPKIKKGLSIAGRSVFSGKVALITNALLFDGWQFGRIYDEMFCFKGALTVSFHVLLGVTVASMAAYSHFAKRGFTVKVIVLICYAIDFASVAGKAIVYNDSFESLVIAWNIARRQIPQLFFDVPGDR